MPTPSQLASLLNSGECLLRHGYILRPRPGAATFLAVTITSHPDQQCTVWETKHRREAYFHHYIPDFVAAKVRRAFPEFTQARATYTELLTLEAESHDDIYDYNRNTGL